MGHIDTDKLSFIIYNHFRGTKWQNNKELIELVWTEVIVKWRNINIDKQTEEFAHSITEEMINKYARSIEFKQDIQSLLGDD